MQRRQVETLRGRLAEPRRLIQLVAGPRQVGKTTLVKQVLESWEGPTHYVSADEPALRDSAWLRAQWEVARRLAGAAGEDAEPAVLVVDEVQKVSSWSETVKRLWDEDTMRSSPLRVVVLGSAPLLMARGLSESLAGRFEVIRLTHWSLSEMARAFGYVLDEYLLFGGYPGAAPLRSDPERWKRYILDALVETTISRDVLLLNRVDKPALLRRLFELACRYSGQVLSYAKMVGQLQDAGNTTTLAHYLELLTAAGMVTGLQKFAGQAVRSRASSPKLQVLNPALYTAVAEVPIPAVLDDPEKRGRIVEVAVGSHLANAAASGICELFYWRDRNREVDFVLRRGEVVTAIEVKSGPHRGGHAGLEAFERTFAPSRSLIVGGDGVPLEDFLREPVESWLV